MQKKKRKLLCAGFAAWFTLASVFSPLLAAAAPTIQSASSPPSISSISGYDQYETAAKIAQSGWTGTSDYAILAAGMSRNLIDALAAGPLAAKLNAPILLTEGNSLNKNALDQLTRLKVKKVYITSGSAVIKQSVIDAVKKVPTVTEVKSLGGYDASETSVNIAKEMVNQGVKIGKVVVTSGAGSDALSMAPVAGAQSMPILYTQGATLSNYVLTYLDSLKASKTYVIGGTGVISDAVKAQIPGSVERYYGQTLYDTNIAVLQQFAGLVNNKITYVANGQTLVDALAGAPLAVKNSSLILLTGKTLPEASKQFAQSNLSPSIVGLGGEAVVPAAVLNQLVPAQTVSLDGSVIGSNDAGSLEQINGTLKVTGNKVTVQNAKTDYSIYVTGDNVTLNNVTVKGTIFLDPGDNGTTTLQKVTANKIVVLSGGSHSINLIDVIAQLLSNQSSSEGVHINASGGTKIERTESSASASFQAEDGSFGIIRITYLAQSPNAAPVVELIGTFTDTIEVGGGVTVTAASGASISNLTVVTDNPDQTVTLKGIYNSVTVETTANVVLGENSSVKDMVTNATTKITLPATSSIGHLDKGSTDTTTSGDGTVGNNTGNNSSSSGNDSGGDDDNPVKPEKPNVTRDDTANTVSGMAAGMEYNLDGAGYIAYNTATFSTLDFSGNHTLLVRVAAAGINPAGDAVTLTFTANPVPVKPAAPNVTRDDTANTVTGMTAGMEYNLDGAGYVAYNAAAFNALDFSGDHTLLVRVAAAGINPASDAVTLTFTANPVPVKPAAPNVTRDDTANTVTGMTAGMEYNLDGAGYVAYDAAAFNALDFSGDHTLLVRVAAAGINPASDAVTLTFTTNAPPAAPSSVNATAVSGRAINVHWNFSSGATGYKVYRDRNPVEIGTVMGTGFVDSGLAPGSTHSYAVKAYNNSGDSLLSGTASATTFAPGTLIVSGVTSGATINHDVTITAQSEGETVTIKDNGNADPGATNVAVKTISTPGTHVLVISATGGASPVNLTFTIDKTVPTVTINGVNDNAILTNNPAGVLLNVTYGGDYLDNTKKVLLDGNPFDITQAIKQPGHHTVSASLQDAAGNIGTASKQFDIVWDTTAPVIAIDGVTGGSTYASAAPAITLSSTSPIADSNLANYTFTATITRPDGQQAVYHQGDAIPTFTAEGSYTLSVDALNPSYVDVTSHKTTQFWIDTTPPTVNISGVQNNQKYNTSVTPVINFGDSVASQALLKANSQALVTLTKNGGNVSYSIGDTISAEGDYILTVSTKDGADHLATPQSISFTIDKTPPVISVTGVTEGTTYRSDVNMTVGTTEGAQPVMLVNGHPENLTGGEYPFTGAANAVTNKTVVITATDSAGNTASKQLSFSIDKLAVSNIITGVTEGQYLKTLPTITFSAYAGNVPLASEATTATLDGINFTSETTLADSTTDGEHTLIVSTAYEGVTYSKTIKFYIDRTAPTASVTTVKKGDVPVASPLYVKAGDIITVAAAVTDDNLQSQSFSISAASGSVSGEIPLTEVGGVLTGTWTVGGGNWNNLVLTVTGKDKAGNIKKADWSHAINIMNTLPDVTLITTPATPDGNNGYFKAADMKVKLQAAAGETITYTFNNGVETQDTTGTVTLTAQQGHNSLTYRVQDQAGNSSASMTFEFEYDSVVPSAPVVTSPVPDSTGRSTTVTIVGTSEAGSTIVVRKAGVDLAEGTVAQDGSFSINGVTLSQGNNALTLVAVDYAGNESLPTAYNLVLDSSSPVLAVTKVDDTHYNVAVNEAINSPTATFNGTPIAAASISGPDASGMYVITTPQPLVGANALFLSASDTAGNIGSGSLTSSYIAPAVAQSNLELSENAMMDIPVGAFSSATQMTVRTGTFAGDSTYKLLGGSLSFNFSEKPAQPVILKILVGTGLKGVTLFHIAEDGTIGDPIVINTTTSTLFDPNAMTIDEGYYLSDTGYLWLKTQNFSDYQAALDDTPPVINFTVTDPVIRINKPGKLGGQMKLEGTVSDLDPAATITGIEIDGVSSPDLLTNHVIGKAFDIPLDLNDGQHKVKLTAEDSAENSTTVKKTFIVDTTPPEFKKATLEGYVAKDGDVYVTNTDGVVLNYLLSKNAEVFVNGQSVGTKNGVNSLTFSLPREGNNMLELKAIDPLENEVSQTFTIRKDTIAPRLTIQGVSEGGVYGSDLHISVTSGESKTLAVSIDGVNKSSSFTYSAASNPGMHTLTAIATDLAGNTTTATVNFTVDVSTPKVQINGVGNGQTYTTDQTLTITAEDARQVFLTKIVDNGAPETVILSSTGGSEVVSCADGEQHTYAFVATAMRITDEGAIYMANQTVIFTIDKKAPVLMFTLGAVDNITGSVSVSGTLDETADVMVYLNESTNPIVTLIGQPAGAFVSNIPLSMGDNTIKVVATDEAGLVSTPVSHTVRRAVSVKSMKASNGQLVLTFNGNGSASLTQSDFNLTAKLNNSDYPLANPAYANGVFTFTPIARAAQDQTLVLSVSPSSTTTYLVGTEVFSQPISIPANLAPAAPSVSTDDVNNVIVGINDTMEYSLDNGTTYVRYSSANPPSLAGNIMVLVRLAATTSFPAGTPKTLVFTLNPVVLDSIAITTPATKLTYTVGETLDLTGLVVTGTYSDNTTKVETITAENVTGFDSANPVTSQTLTITVGSKTTTYTVEITADTSSAFDQLVDKIMEVYGCLTDSDKDALRSARGALQDLDETDSEWDKILKPLLTPQVVALYNGDSVAAKAALIKFMKDFGSLQYSSDRSTLEDNLNTFRNNNRDTFRTLFGDDFTMNQFADFLTAVQKELPKVINGSKVSITGLFQKSNTEIKDQLIAWTKTAMHEVADPGTSQYHLFVTKLSALGLTVDDLVDTQRLLGEAIDPTNAAEKAITLAAIRSQIVCTIPLTMTVGEVKEFQVSIKGVNVGPIALESLLNWHSSNESVAIYTITMGLGRPAIQALQAGTTIITAYAPGTSSELVHIVVTVN